MPNDKRNRQNQGGDEDTDRDVQNELEREEAANKSQDENPQRGEIWSNYRTRELSANEEGSDQNVSNSADTNPKDGGEAGGENFYRNRERGNYEEGQTSDDDGGGSLY